MTKLPVVRFFSLLTRIAFCALIFLIPLTTLPWTLDTLDFHKQMVFVVLGTVLVLSFVGEMIAERELRLKTSPVLWLPFLFVGATLLASLFSLTPYTSWLGESGQEYVSFLATFLLALCFVVGVHLLSDQHFQKSVFGALFVGSGVLSAFVLLSFIGIHIGSLSNTIGSPSTLGLFLLVATVIGQAYLLLPKKELPDGEVKGPLRFGIVTSVVITSIATLVLLASLDSSPLWTLLLVGMLPLFAFVLAQPKVFSEPLRFVFPMLLFVSALFFLFVPSFIQNAYPLEVTPSFSTTLHVLRSVWEEKSWLLGSGPGTFANDYVKFMPSSVNATIFWNTGFDRGSGYVWTLFTTHGLLGGFAFILFFLTTAILAGVSLLRTRVHDSWKDTYGLFAGFLTLFFGAWLLPFNFTLVFFLWMLAALLLARAFPQEKTFSFAHSPRAALASAFVFLLLAVGLFVSLFVSLSRYSAEIAFTEGVVRDREGASIDDVLVLLNRAATQNRWSDQYYRNLGSALLTKTLQLANAENADPEQLQVYASAAINASSQATGLAPNTAENWDVRGQIYREFSPFIDKANDFAVDAFTQASALAPVNPAYLVGLGRTYLVRADLLRPLLEGEDKDIAEQAKEKRDEALKNAQDSLERAIALKNDYTPALYYLAFVLERQGNLADAVKSMESARALNANDIGVSMQLALLYLRQGKNALAQAELERALTFAPTYANARWYLSVIYEGKGDKEKAIVELQKIQETDPENTAVKQRLERLQSGAVAQEEIPEPIDTTVTPGEENVLEAP